MSQTLFQLNARVQAFDVEGEMEVLLRKAEPKIIEANQAQMYAGFRADGTSIEPEYTPFTIKKKKDKGHPSDRVTLKDTAAMYNAMKLDDSDPYKVISTDIKFKSLMNKYGEETMGLDQSDMGKITDEDLTPGITKAFQAFL